jgi:hypothetical protein
MLRRLTSRAGAARRKASSGIRLSAGNR